MAIDQQFIVHLFQKGVPQSEIRKVSGASKGYIHIILRNHGLIPFPPSRLGTELQEKVYSLYSSGKSIREVSVETGVTRYDVTVVLKKVFRTHGQTNHLLGIRRAPTVDESVKQLIIGSLLGDASISKNKNRGYHVRITHSDVQRGYAEYLASKLGVKLHSYRNYGFSKHPSLVLWYKNARFSEFLEKIVLVNGKKRVNLNWLNELALEGIAYWFMDDGSSSRYGESIGVNFSTFGFDRKENELLAEKLTSMGYLTRLNRSRGNGFEWFLNMSRTVTHKFLNDIRPYVWPIKAMRYKLKISS